MQKIYYDFHVHTALSNCADDTHTPERIVKKAKENGLDAIAITDHNSADNVESCLYFAEKVGLTIVPGLEVTTKENIHVLTLFAHYKEAKAFSDYLLQHREFVYDPQHLCGHSLVFHRDGTLAEDREYIPSAPTHFTFYELIQKARAFEAAIIPSHVERRETGACAILHGIRSDADIDGYEISKTASEADFQQYTELKQWIRYYNSDSHRNLSLKLREKYLEAEENTAPSIIRAIRSKGRTL